METLDLDEDSRAFLGAIRDRDRGLWVAAPGDRNRRIADVCRLFPKAPIVVVCQSHREVHRIASALRRELDEPINSARRSGQDHFERIVRRGDGIEAVDMPKDGIRRIAVCTPAALSTNASSGFAIAVLADAENSGCAQYFECTMQRTQNWVRTYGLVPPGWSPTSRQGLAIESICGGRLERAHPPKCPTVVFLKSGGIRPKATADPRERRRARYTLHDARNSRIASIAEALQFGFPEKAFLRMPPPMSALYRTVSAAAALRSVAVICEDVEQLDAMRRYLPDWTGWDLKCRGWIPVRCICTAMFAEKVGIGARVAIRAGGGGGPLRIRWRTFFDDPPGVPDRFVLDFADRFDEAAKSDAERRKVWYHWTGWSVHGDAPGSPARPVPTPARTRSRR